ncbi:MAG: hypothetical protein JNK15_05090 [Planctomycetes bacterium]|nr:hypothetical protein [Planctomycetota bacterium]
MSSEALDEIDRLTAYVVEDWRWVQDDMSVVVLGMILFGLGVEIGRAERIHATEIESAVAHCLRTRFGAGSRWCSELLAEATASATSRSHHPGHYELIETGRTYRGVIDHQALVDNVFANIASCRNAAGQPEPEVPVFLAPLHMLLAGRERAKGSPLTEAEVLAIRDAAVCIRMPLSKAAKYYAELDARQPAPRLRPENAWQQWQAIREQIEW